jgi:hypothetical protein
VTTLYHKKGIPDDLLTSTEEGLRRLKVDCSDFLTEVAKGNIPGHSTRGFVMRSKNIDNTGFKDIWGGASNMVFPTANETWQVRSTSADDTLGGTGSQFVTINYLDSDYIRKSITVQMNGLTPVTLNSDMFLPDGGIAIPSGSAKGNVGNIIIESAAVGNSLRMFIEATICISEDCFAVIPANTTMLAIKASPYWPKGDDGEIRGVIEFSGTNTELITGNFPAYQNTYDVNFKALFPSPEKTVTWFKARSVNPGPITISFVLEVLFIENAYL